MKSAHWFWKPVSIFLFVVAAGGLVLGLFRPTLLWYVATGALTLASLGTLQYAFGWPRIPRAVWRIFGPIFSLILIWPAAQTLGWLATRLVVKHLSPAAFFVTAATLLFLALYALAIVVPLYRLGRWGAEKGSERVDLEETFA